jgi:hypothetical protein
MVSSGHGFSGMAALSLPLVSAGSAAGLERQELAVLFGPLGHV